VVENGHQEPKDIGEMTIAQIATLKTTRAKDKTALYVLYRAVDESGFEKIANAMSSKEAWDIQEKAYKGDNRVKQVRLQTLRGELERMRMKEDERVAEYVARVETVANQLGKNGETLPACRVVEKILRSLTDDFENIVCAIEESKDLTALSMEELARSLEAEYVAASWSVCRAVWLRNLLSKLELKQEKGTVIRVDNKSVIELAKNPVNHERSKHIDVRFHFIREQVKEGNVKLEHVESRAQAAEMFTKPLPSSLFENNKMILGMKDKKSI